MELPRARTGPLETNAASVDPRQVAFRTTTRSENHNPASSRVWGNTIKEKRNSRPWPGAGEEGLSSKQFDAKLDRLEFLASP